MKIKDMWNGIWGIKEKKTKKSEGGSQSSGRR